MNKMRQRGFTLTELIIIVALIGALAVMAIPRMNDTIHSYTADRDVGMMEAFLKSARSIAIANDQMIRIFDENESNTTPYKFSGALKAFHSRLNTNNYASMKALATACTNECVIISKPAVNKNAETSLYYFDETSQSRDVDSPASIAFDGGGSFYTNDNRTYYISGFKAGDYFLVWHYKLGNQQRAIFICAGGMIKLHKGADANISSSLTGVISTAPDPDICKNKIS